MITRGYASTARGQIHYWECGAGAPLVLLAPAPRSARVYRSLLPLLNGFRAIALDTRGFGESAAPDGDLEMSDYAGDVVCVLDALGISRTNLFGLHTGNKIATAVAAGWPHRTNRVVLVGRTHSIIADQAARNAAIQASMAAGPGRLGGPSDRSGLRERWSRMFTELSRIWSDPGAPDSAEFDDKALVLARDEAIDEVEAWAGVDPVYAANFAFDLALTLEQVVAPTLIIELVTAETELLGRQAQLLRARMSDCTTLFLAGHERTLLEKHPEQLAGPVAEFLSRHHPDATAR